MYISFSYIIFAIKSPLYIYKTKSNNDLMNTLLTILIGLALFSVVAVLALGIFSMMKGGEFNEKYGNKLMRARILLQGLAILLLALSAAIAHN